MALPKLPNLGKIQVCPNKVLVFTEPAPTKGLPNLTLLETPQIEKYLKDMRQQEARKLGNLTRGIVLSVPLELESKYPYKVGDLVAIPSTTYDFVVIEGNPITIVGTLDIRVVLNDLTEEEATQWDIDQKYFIDNVINAEVVVPKLDRKKKIITD